VFYLLAQGVERSIVLGYHEGWDFDRLMALYFFLRKQELKSYRDMAATTAVGASALFKGKVLKDFLRDTDKSLDQLESYIAGASFDPEQVKQKQVQQDLNELKRLEGLFGGMGFG